MVSDLVANDQRAKREGEPVGDVRNHYRVPRLKPSIDHSAIDRRWIQVRWPILQDLE